MLRLTGKTEWAKHEPTDTSYFVRAIGGVEYDTLQAAAVRDGKVNFAIFCGLFAAAAIRDWKGVLGEDNQPLPCNPDHTKTFGETHAIHIMPWLIDVSTSIDAYLVKEVDAAKNG